MDCTLSPLRFVLTVTPSKFVLCIAALLARPVGAGDVRLYGDASVHFASVEEGAAVLGRRDAFIRQLSRFDLQSRMNTDQEVTTDDFVKFIVNEVVAWEDDEIDKVSSAVESIREKLAGYRVPFPKTVLFVKTTGKEEGGAAYCRENAVVLPQRVVERPSDALERLLIHELFHITSRHDAELRRKLYAIIRFAPCNEIKLPPPLDDRRITNPDAPTIDYYIELEVNGKATAAVPILYASVNDYKPEEGGSFFRYLLFRMMVVEKNGERWRPIEMDGQPVTFDAKKLPAYFEKIGNNTGYVIHPDEILADNFVHLVNQSPELATPSIVEKMKAVLSK